MSHENLDKDPDLRKSSEFARQTMSSGTWAVIVLVGLLIFVSTFIVAHYWSPDWGPNQWGNVGTWVAGAATVAAVFVAVWQTNNANDQVRRTELRADREVSAANERTRQQIESQRRAEQIQVTANVWAAVGEVHRHVWNVDEVLYKIEKGTGTDEELARAYDSYAAALTRMTTTITAAYMIVRDSAIENLIGQTETAHDLLVKSMQKAYRDSENEGHHDQESLILGMKAVNDLRQPMIEAARRYLDAAKKPI